MRYKLRRFHVGHTVPLQLSNMIVPFTLLLVFGLWNNNLVSSQATDPTYSQWNIKVEYDQFGGTPPKCLAECNTSCVQGESLCFANLIHVDTPDKKLNPLDEKFYVHCMCSKSTIRRDPGLFCGPGITCPGATTTATTTTTTTNTLE